MSAPGSYDAESLLGQAGWVRQLARTLVRDPDLADDLAQEAWLAALQRAPDPSLPLEPWFTTVLRNLAARARRTRGRRSDRELAAARSEALPSAAELVERAAVHRELVQAVMGLEEPYRTTLLLRYLEELPPRTIAARQSVPVRTVHTRLQRGLHMLRARLDREHASDRSRWLAGLAAFGRAEHGEAAAAGPAAWGAYAALGAVLLAAATVAFLWFQRTSGERASSELELAQRSAPAAGEVPALLAPAAGRTEHAERRDVAQPPQSAAAPPNASALGSFDGRVVDTDGRGVAGALIAAREVQNRRLAIFDPPLERATLPAGETFSDGEGWFRLALASDRPHELEVSRAGFARVLVDHAASGGTARIELEPACTVVGTVTDENGGPLAEVLLRALASAGRTGEREVARAHTNGDGRFDLEELPSGSLAVEATAHDGRLRARLDLELARGSDEVRDLALVLARGAVVTGRVIDRVTREPIPGARASDDPHFARAVECDAAGRFELAGLTPGATATVRVAAPGYAARSRSVEPSAEGVEVAFELERGATVRGRVVDRDGTPIPGAFVAAIGDRGRGREHEADRCTTASDADGRFELADLRADLEHQLLVAASGRATHSATLGRAAPLELGEVVLAPPGAVRGIVYGADGAPLAGAGVYLVRLGDAGVRAASADPRLLAAGRIWAEARTDARGRFEFVDLPAGAWLASTGSDSGRERARADFDLAEGGAHEIVLAVPR